MKRVSVTCSTDIHNAIVVGQPNPGIDAAVKFGCKLIESLSLGQIPERDNTPMELCAKRLHQCSRVTLSYSNSTLGRIERSRKVMRDVPVVVLVINGYVKGCKSSLWQNRLFFNKSSGECSNMNE